MTARTILIATGGKPNLDGLDVLRQLLDTLDLLVQAVGHVLRNVTHQSLQSRFDLAEQGVLAFGEGCPKLVEQPAQRIGLHSLHLHEHLTLAVQRQRGLLRQGLDAHELGARLLHGQPDGPRVGGVGPTTIALLFRNAVEAAERRSA